MLPLPKLSSDLGRGLSISQPQRNGAIAVGSRGVYRTVKLCVSTLSDVVSA